MANNTNVNANANINSVPYPLIPSPASIMLPAIVGATPAAIDAKALVAAIYEPTFISVDTLNDNIEP